MNSPRNEDPLEKLLRAQPLESAPTGVYERLQAKAVWNRPPAIPRLLLIGGALVCAAIFAAFLLFTTTVPSGVQTPEQTPPAMVPATSAPVVARLVPEVSPARDEDLIQEIGGLSSRWTFNEPEFAVSFGPMMTHASAGDPETDS